MKTFRYAIALAAALSAAPATAEQATYGAVDLEGLARDVSWPLNAPGETFAMVCNVKGPDGFLSVRGGPGSEHRINRSLKRLATVTVDTSQRRGRWVRVLDANREFSTDGKPVPPKSLTVGGWAHDGYLCAFTDHAAVEAPPVAAPPLSAPPVALAPAAPPVAPPVARPLLPPVVQEAPLVAFPDPPARDPMLEPPVRTKRVECFFAGTGRDICTITREPDGGFALQTDDGYETYFVPLDPRDGAEFARYSPNASTGGTFENGSYNRVRNDPACLRHTRDRNDLVCVYD